MIFTSWNFGPEEFAPYVWCRNLTNTPGKLGRDAARLYAADIFNVCAARRDYPYGDHPWPAIPWPLPFCAAVEILQNVVREFNRSNPGHEVVANFNF